MVMPSRSVVIGTAGHIDHGKTALIRALTGVDCDRLMEEKRRGITIDLGFASLNAKAEDDAPLRISFVDVPGHKLFIRNMLAGAGCVAAVLLVVSAEEGIKPQTEEHLAICSLLGIRRGLVAITKVDLVSPERLKEVTAKVRSFLAGSFLGQSHARIIPVSAHTGVGLEDLRRELITLAGATSIGYPDTLLRLPLDRSFVMKGFGAVVTGTLLSGVLQTGQALVLEPGGREVRVRGIQVHNHTENHAHAGSRVALNLSGIDASEIARGQTLVEQQSLGAATLLDVEVTLIPGAAALKHRASVHFHAFTSDTVATVSLYTYAPVEPGERRLLRLKLSQPVVLVPGDRFVLRQSSPAITIGGGRVLDVHPLQNLRKSGCLAWLQKLQNAPVERQLLLRVDRRGNAGIDYRDLSLEMGLQRETLHRVAKPMIQRGTLIEVSSELLMTPEHIQSVTESVITCMKADTLHAGLKRSEVRSQLRLRAQVFDFVLARLAANGKLTVTGDRFYSVRADATPPAAQATTLSAIADAFRSAGLATPLAAEVAARLNLSDADLRRHMTLLLRDGVLVKMGNNEVYIHRDALQALRLQLANWRGKTIDVSGFKELTGLTRKHAIPLLEYLDRERVTRKDGDRRLVL
jgi:selenocysteine-specific elongation factor